MGHKNSAPPFVANAIVPAMQKNIELRERTVQAVSLPFFSLFVGQKRAFFPKAFLFFMNMMYIIISPENLLSPPGKTRREHNCKAEKEKEKTRKDDGSEQTEFDI